MFKRKKKFQITVSAYEYRMILDALMSSREKLMAQGRYTDAVDDGCLLPCKHRFRRSGQFLYGAGGILQ